MKTKKDTHCFDCGCSNEKGIRNSCHACISSWEQAFLETRVIDFHLAHETTWLKKKKIKVSDSKGRAWSFMAYFNLLPVLLWK